MHKSGVDNWFNLHSTGFSPHPAFRLTSITTSPFGTQPWGFFYYPILHMFRIPLIPYSNFHQVQVTRTKPPRKIRKLYRSRIKQTGGLNMQYTVCQHLQKAQFNESSVVGTEQQVINVSDTPPLDIPLDNPFNKPRFVLRDKLDRSRKMRISIPLVMPVSAVGLGHGLGLSGITTKLRSEKTRKKPLVSAELPSKTGKSIKNVPMAIGAKKPSSTTKSSTAGKPSTTGERLLTDIIAIMKENHRSKMRSKQLLIHLCADPKKPGRHTVVAEKTSIFVSFPHCSRNSVSTAKICGLTRKTSRDTRKSGLWKQGGVVEAVGISSAVEIKRSGGRENNRG